MVLKRQEFRGNKEFTGLCFCHVVLLQKRLGFDLMGLGICITFFFFNMEPQFGIKLVKYAFQGNFFNNANLFHIINLNENY